jgi:hypothetical protein
VPALLVLSTPMIQQLFFANVDGFVLWGLAIRGPIGLLLLSTKPHVASLVAVVWILRAYQSSGLAGALRLTWLTLLAIVVGTLIYPHWLRQMLTVRDQVALSLGMWPFLVPFALVLVLISVQLEADRYSALASLWLSPYMRFQSLIVVFAIGAAEKPRTALAWLLLSWSYFGYKLILYN